MNSRLKAPAGAGASAQADAREHLAAQAGNHPLIEGNRVTVEIVIPHQGSATPRQAMCSRVRAGGRPARSATRRDLSRRIALRFDSAHTLCYNPHTSSLKQTVGGTWNAAEPLASSCS